MDVLVKNSHHSKIAEGLGKWLRLDSKAVNLIMQSQNVKAFTDHMKQDPSNPN